MKTNRQCTVVKRTLAQAGDSFVPGTPAERIAMVWPLTREVAALSNMDVDKPLQRGITRLFRRGDGDKHAQENTSPER